MSDTAFYRPMCQRLKAQADGLMIQMLKLEPVMHPVEEPVELMPGFVDPFRRIKTVTSYERRTQPMMVCRDCLPSNVEGVELG